MHTLKIHLAAALTVAIAGGQLVHGDEPAGETWQMEIIPAAKLHTEVPSLVKRTQPDGSVVEFDPAEYSRIYKSIPFRRAEFNNNPGYRHDATMEILTGNAHHQTIVRHNHEHPAPVQTVPAPLRPSRVLTPFSGSFWFPGSLYGPPGLGWGQRWVW
jgi:hypothetical protein